MNSFGPYHYVPFLKVLKNEKEALGDLPANLKPNITPFLEITRREVKSGSSQKTLKEHIETAIKGMEIASNGYSRFFLDTIQIAPEGVTVAGLAFSEFEKLSIPFTPVTGVSRTSDVKEVLKYKQNGLCLRFTRTDFEAGLANLLPAFAQDLGFKLDAVDLIVDLGAVDDMILPGVQALMSAMVNSIPSPEKWKTFTVSGCAMPIGTIGIPTSSHGFIERNEWVAWLHSCYNKRLSLKRLPTFSDCGVQHPAGVV